MNVVQEIERIKVSEAKLGIFGGLSKASWHEKYRLSAWVYVGGLSYELSEGDILCFMSQWGEIEDINLIRDKDTGKSLGFCFVKYEDQRSTILAVDNFNGIVLLERTLRVDHVDRYKLPKEIREREEQAIEEDPSRDVLIGPGHAYTGKELENDLTIEKGVNLWQRPTAVPSNIKEHMTYKNTDNSNIDERSKKHKKDKKDRSKEKKLKHRKADIDDKDRRYRHRSSSRDATMSRSAPAETLAGPAVQTLEKASVRPDPAGPPLGESASWRGRYDPAAAVISRPNAVGQKRIYPDSAASRDSGPNAPPVKKSFFESASSSFGGMSRRR